MDVLSSHFSALSGIKSARTPNSCDISPVDSVFGFKKIAVQLMRFMIYYVVLM